MFPVSISMAATWDPPLVHDVAAAISDEGRAVYNYWHTVQGTAEAVRGQAVTVTADGKRIAHNGLVYRSPVINMDRDPRWGRIWETFGEDPLLASRITVAYVQGTQGNDPKYLELAATLKHFAAYDDERDRVKTGNDIVPERTLKKLLPAAVQGRHYRWQGRVHHVVVQRHQWHAQCRKQNDAHRYSAR